MSYIQNERISVIVPVYNTERYLEKCLSSLTNQTYSELEIICIDDGSTDKSLEILRRFADQDHRISVFLQKHKGTAAARNAGLDAATGAWITFVDSDDWLELTMYESLLMYGNENPADILACGYWFGDSDCEREAINQLPVPSGTQDMRGFLYYVYCRDKYKGVTSYIWNKLFRSSKLIMGGGRIRFDESLGSLGEDIDWFSRYCIQAQTIAYIPQSLYHHRERTDSAFHSLNQRLRTMQHIRAYEKIIALYENNQIDNNVLDYVKRFYVYHLGMLMEVAQRMNDYERAKVLREKAIPYLDIYIRTNQDNLDRIKWARTLFET